MNAKPKRTIAPELAAQPRVCLTCGIEFRPMSLGYNGRYCNSHCKYVAKYARDKSKNPNLTSEVVAYKRRRRRTDPLFNEKHKEQCATARNKTRDWLASYKLSIGCVDCGFKGHYAALQLDHEGPKSVAISQARSSIGRLKAEIEAGDCKVRCANCHAIKTWERKQKKSHDGPTGKGCDQ
jgi:hypothetical protein